MLPAASFDKLNRLIKAKRSMPYEKYFGEMELTESEKKKRISLAQIMEEKFTYVMILLFTMQQYNSFNWDFAKKEFVKKYLESIDGYATTDSEFEQYISMQADRMTESTKENTNNPYYFSLDRAKFIAENESNTVRSFQCNQEAMQQNKTYKRWVSIMDGHTRLDHKKADGQIVKINDPFVVGDSLLNYPRDASLGADSSEIINCRCSVIYY